MRRERGLLGKRRYREVNIADARSGLVIVAGSITNVQMSSPVALINSPFIRGSAAGFQPLHHIQGKSGAIEFSKSWPRRMTRITRDVGIIEGTS
jgi:hypothetical protein